MTGRPGNPFPSRSPARIPDFVDPRVRLLAYARWHLITGGTHWDWLFLGKNSPDALIQEARDWLRAAVAAGLLPLNPDADGSDQAGTWPTLAALVDWLDTTNGRGDHETAMRLMKVTEEAGEAVAAYIGTVGQNPRKGRTHTAGDVAAELCDVALTALVALHSFVPDPEATFREHLAKVAARVGVNPQGGDR